MTTMVMEYNKAPISAGKRGGAICFIIWVSFFGAGRTLILINIVSKLKRNLLFYGSRKSGEQTATEGFEENYAGGSKGGFVFKSGYIRLVSWLSMKMAFII
jgi:hypothetical protein